MNQPILDKKALKAQEKAEKEALKDRFVKLSTTTLAGEVAVLVDKETGIEYLYHGSGYGGGLTVLLDRSGKPKINKDFL